MNENSFSRLLLDLGYRPLSTPEDFVHKLSPGAVIGPGTEGANDHRA